MTVTITIPLPRPVADAWESLTVEQRAAVVNAGQDAIDAEVGRLLGVTA